MSILYYCISISNYDQKYIHQYAKRKKYKAIYVDEAKEKVDLGNIFKSI